MELNVRIKLFESKFSSSVFVGGSLLTPDRLEISDTGVTYKKRNKHLIGVDEITIPFKKISSVEIDRKVINADIIVHSTGSTKIVAENFTVSSAKEAKKEIESKI